MTQTILFLTPDLEPCGATTQLLGLASGLSAERFDRTLCVLRRPIESSTGKASSVFDPRSGERGYPNVAAFARTRGTSNAHATGFGHAGLSNAGDEQLDAVGVRVQPLDWHRLIDLSALARFRTLLQEHRPDVVHASRLPALAVAWLVRRWNGGRLIVSSPLHPRDAGGRTNGMSRWLLRRADTVVASDNVEAERLRKYGVRDDRLAVIPPGVAAQELQFSSTESAEIRRRLGLPDGKRLLLVVGPLERYKGGYEAIWAFDMLGQLFPDLHLVLVGAGRDLPRLRHFADKLRGGRRVHFAGPQPDVPRLLSAADVVWAPVWTDAGRWAVLEAMAAGIPVVASRTPALEAIIVDGETGFLVTPGDKAGLGRQTRLLLDDEPRRRQMGQSARQRVVERFSAPAMLQAFGRLYVAET